MLPSRSLSALSSPARATRALSYLYLGGATLALLSVIALPMPPGTDRGGMGVLVAIAALAGGVLLLGADRLPAWAASVALALGTAVVGADIYFVGGGGVNNEMFYVLVTVYAFYFLATRVALAQMAFLGVSYAVVLELRSVPDGATRWMLTMGTLLLAGLLLSELVSRLGRSMALSRAREAELREAEERFRSSFEDAAVGMALVGLDGRWLRVNAAFAAMTGYPRDDLAGMSFRDLTPPEDLALDELAFAGMVSGRLGNHHSEKRYRRADGEIVWVELSVSTVRDGEDQPIHLISQMQDVTARKAAQRELADRALRDPLTGLPNRLLFADRVQMALARTERSGTPVSVLFIDLDRFKLVNDSLGHAFGDRMLIEVGRRLRRVVRPADTVARFGGDEFTLLCENIDEPAGALLAERILATLGEPVALDGHELSATASIGIAVEREHSATAEGMLRDSDAAMYRAKDQGGSRFALFDGGLRLRATERLELETDLRRGIERDELRLVYQPDVELSTGRILCVEALVRWQHPRRGMLVPEEFIPVAEESGLIVPLGKWVICAALEQLSAWRAEDVKLSVSVNISSRQLADPYLPGIVAAAIEASDADPADLCLEITESAAVAVGARALAALKASGVSLALDDFGAGLSSLHQIRRLQPVDTLKIDRSFVESLGERPADTAIIAAIVGIGQALEMATVAEGIQSEAQVRVLRELGCSRGQGHHFGGPAAPASVVAMAKSAALGELIGR